MAPPRTWNNLLLSKDELKAGNVSHRVFYKPAQIEDVDVVEMVVFTVAATERNNLVATQCGNCVESFCSKTIRVSYGKLVPVSCFQVKKP